MDLVTDSELTHYTTLRLLRGPSQSDEPRSTYAQIGLQYLCGADTLVRDFMVTVAGLSGQECPLHTSCLCGETFYGRIMTSFGPVGSSNFTPRCWFCFSVAAISRAATSIFRDHAPSVQ